MKIISIENRVFIRHWFKWYQVDVVRPIAYEIQTVKLPHAKGKTNDR